MSAFYTGVGYETVKGVADSFLFFLAYSYLRQRRLNARDSGRSLPVLEEIGVGVVAGAFSKLFTTPIQQIVTRKQTAAMAMQDPTSPNKPVLSTADIVNGIYREKGLQGFWSGYSATLVLTLNPSITMLLHKVLLRLLVPSAKRNDPGSRATFLLAAVSKALASTVTYPFSLAKTRAQVSSQKPTTTTGETSELNKSDKPHDSRTTRLRQKTVFSTILRIAQTEGIWGLYQGLGAEVLKGFFSHGITMLMKDRIHSAIISLYYTVSQALQNFSSAREFAENASEGSKDLIQQGQNQANAVYTKSIELGSNANEKIKEAVAQGSEQIKEVVEKGKQQVEAASATAQEVAKSSSQQAAEVFNAGKDNVTSAYQQTGEVVEKAQNMAKDASQKAYDAVIQTDVKDIEGGD